MVVADVLAHQPFQVPLIEHDDMVKQVASAIANPAFSDSVLPRTAETGPFRLDAEARNGTDHLFVEVRGAVEDQIFRRRIVRKRLAKLLGDPCAARMPGDVAVKDEPPAMRDGEEAIKHAKP